MDEVRLAALAKAASYLRVIAEDGRTAAFLMAFRKGDAYDGTNFAWSAQRYVTIFSMSIAWSWRRNFAGAPADRFGDDLDRLPAPCGVVRITLK